MRAPSTMQWIRLAGQRTATGSGRLAVLLAARAVHAGRRLWQRAEAWLGEPLTFGWLLRLAGLILAALAARKVAVSVGGGLYAAAADGRAPWLMWGAASTWTVAAYRCGRDGWEPKQRASTDEPTTEAHPDVEDQDDPPKPATEQAPAGPPPISPVALVAAVRDIGTPHAQLKPLAEHLGTTTDAVRAAAAVMGWPVKDVRMGGRSSSAGLRWDEIPSPDQDYPDPGVVGAGQPADDNDDDSDVKGLRKGFRVVPIGASGRIVYDPRDTSRHHPAHGRNDL